MKRNAAVSFLLLFSLWLSGCQGRQAAAPARCAVVTGVDVECRYEDYVLQRVYSTEEKINAVLTYLRLLSPKQLSGEDPEQIAGERYVIRLHFSSGPDQIYYQHSNRFLSARRSPWQAVSPTKAGKLHDLMLHFPSDTNENPTG